MQTHHFRAVGSPCVFYYQGGSEWSDSLVAMLAVDEIRRIEAKYSLFSEASLLADINRAAALGAAIEVDDETAGLLDFAFACFEKSQGLFDITAGILRQRYDFKAHTIRPDVDIPALLARTGMEKLDWLRPRLAFREKGMRIDFGGLGKEYAVDRAGRIFLSHDILSGLVDLGGDLLALGPPPDADHWLVGVRDPLAGEGLIAEVPLVRGAVATSGDYENHVDIDGIRHSHIIDPTSGVPTSATASVTVMAETCMAAGAAATIAMLKGDGAVDWLMRQTLPFIIQARDGERFERLPTAALGDQT